MPTPFCQAQCVQLQHKPGVISVCPPRRWYHLPSDLPTAGSCADTRGSKGCCGCCCCCCRCCQKSFDDDDFDREGAARKSQNNTQPVALEPMRVKPPVAQDQSAPSGPANGGSAQNGSTYGGPAQNGFANGGAAQSGYPYGGSTQNGPTSGGGQPASQMSSGDGNLSSSSAPYSAVGNLSHDASYGAGGPSYPPADAYTPYQQPDAYPSQPSYPPQSYELYSGASSYPPYPGASSPLRGGPTSSSPPIFPMPSSPSGPSMPMPTFPGPGGYGA